MDIQVIRKPRYAPRAPDIGSVIGELGSAGFPDKLFAEVRKLCGCAHFVALASSQREPIKVIFATNEGAAPLARETAKKYIADHWRYDPINAVLPQLGPADVSVRTTPQDIGSGQYRTECYSLPKLIERISILRRRDGVTNRLHLYRTEGNGPFSNQELDAIADMSEVLFALVAKHSELCGDAADTVDPDLRRRIALLAPDLPRRETEVCLGIVQGQTTEAIALSLGISANTVLTYRKRAYARLHITSANELLRLIYASHSACA